MFNTFIVYKPENTFFYNILFSSSRLNLKPTKESFDQIRLPPPSNSLHLSQAKPNYSYTIELHTQKKQNFKFFLDVSSSHFDKFEHIL